jgi:hypothetical protein
MFGAYLRSSNLEVNYDTTKAVSLTDPCARALARALGFRSPKELMLWNDARGRTIGEVLARLDFAIGKTAPAPADPLIGVDGYALAATELPARLEARARVWHGTIARICTGWARRLTFRSLRQRHIQPQLGAQSAVSSGELALEAVGAGAAPSEG